LKISPRLLKPESQSMLKIEDYISQLKGPILVLGSAGFIGANLFNKLIEHRNDVYAVVKNNRSWRLSFVSDENLIATDLNDFVATRSLIDNIQPQTIFNCAAYGAYSFEDETHKIFETNFISLVFLLGLLNEKSISAFVQAGSSSEYGDLCAAPLESDLPQPNSIYSVSKVACSNLINFYGKKKKFPIVNLRLYSVYGPLEDTSRLIPNLILEATKGAFPPLVEKSISRDYVYVDDACNAFILAAARMNPDMFGDSYNIGTGIKTTMADLSDLIKKEFNLQVEPVFNSMPNRSWDLQDWFANPLKANRELNWLASTSMNEGIRETRKWIENLTSESFKVYSKKNRTSYSRSISAIVACYKDEQAIPIMHSRLSSVFQKLSVDYEIIFVNDCSPDNTQGVIQEISTLDPRVVGISHSRNFGSQMAFRSGMEVASKNAVVLLDGDLQDPPELIEEFHAKWCEGFEVVYGRRIKRDMPFYWEFLYKLFYKIFAAFSNVNIPKNAGDFSLIDRKVFKWILLCEERDLFLRGLRAYVGFKQIGVDYFRPKRAFGKSTNSLLRNIEWAKRGIFSFSNTPLSILTATGFVLLSISIIITFILISLKLIWPDIAPKGITTTLIFILMFGSANLFALGLVGEYVGKIMLEVKQRPRLIRTGFIRNGNFSENLPDGKRNSSSWIG